MEPAWNHVGGVHIFRGIKNDRWHAYYIGQVDSFKTRLVPSQLPPYHIGCEAYADVWIE